MKNSKIHNEKTKVLPPIAASSLMQAKACGRKVDCRLSNNRLSDNSNDPHIYNYIGKRQYELSNHLGNVLTVVSDRKYARDIDQNGEVDYFEPDILLTYDYSPFGVILKERAFVKQVCRDTAYVNNFIDINDEFANSNIGGWIKMGASNNVLSIPAATQYLKVNIGNASSGSLMGAQKDFALNYVGNHIVSFSFNTDVHQGLNGNNIVEVVITDLTTNTTTLLTTLNQTNGWQNYTFTYNAQNVGNYRLHFKRIGSTNSNKNFLLDNIKITHQEVVEECICEAYGKYRYAFNGMEKDDEVKGSGNSYTTEFRQYDSRLGRFLSIDLLAASFPWYSPYVFAGNMSIASIDIDGLEIYYSADGELLGKWGTSTKVRIISNKNVADFKNNYTDAKANPKSAAAGAMNYYWNASSNSKEFSQAMATSLKTGNLMEAGVYGQQSATFQTLNVKSTIIIDTKGAGTYTTDGGKINIGTEKKSKEERVIGLAWELTNYQNHKTLDNLADKAWAGTISQTDYADQKMKIEVAALINSMQVADELGITYWANTEFSKDLADYKSGAITFSQLETIIITWAKIHVDTEDPQNPGKQINVYNAYKKQHTDLKNQGVKDRSNGKTKR